MRRSWWMAAGLSTALLVTGCAPAESQNTSPVPLRAQGVARVVPPADAPVSAVTQGVTAFGYELGKVDVAPTENWVVSPASIAYGFAMARAGAAGETAAEIDRVFGFPQTGVHEAFNAITRQVVTDELPPAKSAGETRQPGPSKPPVVCVANALFPKAGLAVGDEFLRTLAAQYGAAVYPVDFTKPTAKEAIDSWVRTQTAERVQQLVADLPPATTLALANAVYLKADWEFAFAKEPTTDQVFHRADGTTVPVPTMRLSQSLRYASGAGWQAVELQLVGGQLAMWILVPSGGPGDKDQLTPHDLLSPASMTTVSAALRHEDVGLALPRWDFASNVDLTAALMKLGVVYAFAHNADFSGIHPDLHIDQAVHKATITVDEWGTEAAAVTGLVLAPSGPVPPKVEVRADHPFAFAIVHGPTGLPLFMGHVADPSSHG